MRPDAPAGGHSRSSDTVEVALGARGPPLEVLLELIEIVWPAPRIVSGGGRISYIVLRHSCWARSRRQPVRGHVTGKAGDMLTATCHAATVNGDDFEDDGGEHRREPTTMARSFRRVLARTRRPANRGHRRRPGHRPRGLAELTTGGSDSQPRRFRPRMLDRRR